MQAPSALLLTTGENLKNEKIYRLILDMSRKLPKNPKGSLLSPDCSCKPLTGTGNDGIGYCKREPEIAGATEPRSWHGKYEMLL